MELADRFNLEGEIGYASADLSERTDISELTAMANVTSELPLASSLDLVLGGGLGISNYSWDSWAVAPPSREESDVGMAYQAITGLDLGLAPGVDLSLRYRYRVTDAGLRGAAVNNTGAFGDLDGLDSQIVTVGLTFGF